MAGKYRRQAPEVSVAFADRLPDTRRFHRGPAEQWRIRVARIDVGQDGEGFCHNRVVVNQHGHVSARIDLAVCGRFLIACRVAETATRVAQSLDRQGEHH